ncbi:MAG: hypothetical protein Q9212_005903 [Teloschistes hypoglaucus]
MPSPETGDTHRHSPPSHSRSRSRSPPPHHRRRTDDSGPKASKGGFRWKDKSNSTDHRGPPNNAPLARGYRDRDRRERDEYRERRRDNEERDRGDRGRLGDGYGSRRNDGGRYGARSPERRGEDRYRDGGSRRSHERRREDRDRDGEHHRRDNHQSHESPQDNSKDESTTASAPATESLPKKEKKSKKPSIAPAAEPMIIVNVNDRLGTKASIPCLPSDTIRDFKKLVAGHIGREPHEIMLKRQGERPFKDVLTLEDYGVSNGVQLDLEVDTGD